MFIEFVPLGCYQQIVNLIIVCFFVNHRLLCHLHATFLTVSSHLSSSLIDTSHYLLVFHPPPPKSCSPPILFPLMLQRSARPGSLHCRALSDMFDILGCYSVQLYIKHIPTVSRPVSRLVYSVCQGWRVGSRHCGICTHFRSVWSLQIHLQWGCAEVWFELWSEVLHELFKTENNAIARHCHQLSPF